MHSRSHRQYITALECITWVVTYTSQMMPCSHIYLNTTFSDVSNVLHMTSLSQILLQQLVATLQPGRYITATLDRTITNDTSGFCGNNHVDVITNITISRYHIN
jgi:hypothetical protein